MESTGTQSFRLLREHAEGIDLVRLTQDAREEAFLNLAASPAEPPAATLQRLADWLDREPRWQVVRQDIFGVPVTGPLQREARARRMDGSRWPVTWVEQGNGEGAPLAGLQARVMAGVEFVPVRHAGRQVGLIYEDEWARYCELGGVLPPRLDRSRKAQTAETLDLMNTLLGQAGMSFTDVIRTWFYLDDILEWYDEFNDARNRFFKRHGIYDRLVPASTGIGGNNSAGAALVANAIAAVPKTDAFQVTALPSPLQCPALEYGSSFSRAVEIRVPGQQRVLVSGTASIEPGGATTHVGDVEAQVATTMEVIEAILKSRGLGWEDSVRAIAYFKHTDDLGALDRYCRSRGLPPLPVIITKTDVCRDDLLFELEVDAIRVA